MTSLSSPIGMQCIPQRAALLKSMLNFLKKAIQDPAFSEGIRHGKMCFYNNAGWWHISSLLCGCMGLMAPSVYMLTYVLVIAFFL